MLSRLCRILSQYANAQSSKSFQVFKFMPSWHESPAPNQAIQRQMPIAGQGRHPRTYRRLGTSHPHLDHRRGCPCPARAACLCLCPSHGHADSDQDPGRVRGSCSPRGRVQSTAAAVRHLFLALSPAPCLLPVLCLFLAPSLWSGLWSPWACDAADDRF